MIVEKRKSGKWGPSVTSAPMSGMTRFFAFDDIVNALLCRFPSFFPDNQEIVGMHLHSNGITVGLCYAPQEKRATQKKRKAVSRVAGRSTPKKDR